MSRDDLNFRDDKPIADPSRPGPRGEPGRPRTSRALRITGIFFLLLAILAVVGYFTARHYVRQSMAAALPQLDGSVVAYGLTAPVTIERDDHGVPHIRATSMDDLVFAQGYVTAQDRLWQMELLRRHAAGELAAILGSSWLDHDRLQRTLQLRVAADRALTVMPADQKHWLEVYARGVNASIVAQQPHLPLEFRLIRETPAPWTPRDSMLVELAMFQDLTTGFLIKLDRDSLSAHLPPELIADLYPTGSWRDHPPGQPAPDLTAPQPEFVDIPLDESQSRLQKPYTTPTADLLAAQRTLALFHDPCASCLAGSNSWVVAGARTASGKPMLSNDMHLALNVPGLWYEADLDAQNPAPLADFHAAGVTLPGTPFVIAGHNAHVAWGFTNLGADVQDLYIEHTRGTPGGAEYQAIDGSWHPVLYRREIIHVRGRADVILDVPIVRHGDAETPIISSIFPGEKRTLSLRWTIYDPANITSPFFSVNSAGDWNSMLAAFQNFGGPAQNLMYADDQGHIGYHAVGRIPVRGDSANPSPLSPVPTDIAAPDAATHEWAGYIPFDQLPQAFDPPDGVLATANARITLEGYRYPITLNWQAPYRTERIYKVLEGSPGHPLEPRRQMTPADMLALQTDVFSKLDQIVAHRLVYSIDHTTGRLKNDKTLHQAADLMRNWNGSVDADATAPAIVNAAREVFWPMLLVPKLAPQLAPGFAKGEDLPKNVTPAVAQNGNLWQAYVWGERGSVEEQITYEDPRALAPARLCQLGGLPGRRRRPRPAQRSRAPRPEQMEAGLRQSRRPRTPHLLPFPTARRYDRSAHRDRRPASERRRDHRQVGRPHLRADRALHRRPERPRPHHTQHRPRPVRQCLQPVLPRPVPRVASRHYFCSSVHLCCGPRGHHPYPGADAAMTPEPWPSKRRHFLVLACVALFAIHPLILHGCSCGHDFDFHLLSWVEAATQFAHGNLHPNWAYTPAFDAGEPRFVFYPPISWALGAILGLILTHLPGVSEVAGWAAAPIVFTWIALTASGLTMYRLAREFVTPNAALLAATLYLVNPYMLFSAYERTAYGELLAAAWMPLLFLGILRARVTVAGIAVPLALLWLTNAPAGVMGSYTLALLAVIRVVRRDGMRLQLALKTFAGTALGLALAAVYIIPAAYERRYVQVRMAIVEGVRIADNTLFHHTGTTPDQLFHDQVLHTASVIAVLLLIATAAALIALFAFRRRAQSSANPDTPFSILPLAILTAAIAFLLTPSSLPLWNHVPQAEFLQFPWRLLAVLGPVFALAIAGVVERLRLNSAFTSTIVLVAAIGLTVPAYRAFHQYCYPEDTVPARLALFHSRIGTDPTDEYAPTGADDDALKAADPPYWLAASANAPAPANGLPGPAPLHFAGTAHPALKT